MTLMSNPVLAQDGHWIDNLLPYILFDIAFAVALWVVIALVKITTKLLTIKLNDNNPFFINKSLLVL